MRLLLLILAYLPVFFIQVIAQNSTFVEYEFKFVSNNLLSNIQSSDKGVSFQSGKTRYFSETNEIDSCITNHVYSGRSKEQFVYNDIGKISQIISEKTILNHVYNSNNELCKTILIEQKNKDTIEVQCYYVDSDTLITKIRDYTIGEYRDLYQETIKRWWNTDSTKLYIETHKKGSLYTTYIDEKKLEETLFSDRKQKTSTNHFLNSKFIGVTEYVSDKNGNIIYITEYDSEMQLLKSERFEYSYILASDTPYWVSKKHYKSRLDGKELLVSITTRVK